MRHDDRIGDAICLDPAIAVQTRRTPRPGRNLAPEHKRQDLLVKERPEEKEMHGRESVAGGRIVGHFNAAGLEGSLQLFAQTLKSGIVPRLAPGHQYRLGI